MYEARKKSQKKYYYNNREKILQIKKENYQESYYGNHEENKRKANENRKKRARKGKTEEEIKNMDYRLKWITARRKEKESIRNERGFYNKIIKRDINISLLKNRSNITSKEACIAVSCKPAQNFLEYILETNPTLEFNFSKEELKERLILIQKSAFKKNKFIFPNAAVAIVLYQYSLYTQTKIAQICKTTAVSMRHYIKILKLNRRGVKEGK